MFRQQGGRPIDLHDKIVKLPTSEILSSTVYSRGIAQFPPDKIFNRYSLKTAEHSQSAAETPVSAGDTTISPRFKILFKKTRRDRANIVISCSVSLPKCTEHWEDSAVAESASQTFALLPHLSEDP